MGTYRMNAKKMNIEHLNIHIWMGFVLLGS